MASQLLVLIGVVVGSVLSFGATYLTERARWKRSQSVKWDDVRLSAFADYAHAVKQVVMISNRICAGRGLATTAQPLKPIASSFAELAGAEHQRTISAETLRLLIDTETDDAAREMTQCAWRVEQLARGLEDAKPADWERAMDAYQQARSHYTDCARRSLQVRGSLRYASYGRRAIRQEGA